MMIETPTGMEHRGGPSIDLQIRRKYGSQISGMISGHTLVNLAMANIHIPPEYQINGEYTLKMMKKRYYLILLGMITWMVPFDHSIWEILLAGNSSIMDFYGGWFRACEFSIKHNLTSQVQEIIDQVMCTPTHQKVTVNEMKTSDMKTSDTKTSGRKEKYSVDREGIITLNRRH